MQWDDVAEPSPDFVGRVLQVVEGIPPGRVMTYGDIAAQLEDHADLAGASAAFGARHVGRVMARSGASVAWWRVIRAGGEPPKFHEEEAWAHYIDEGTPLTGPRERYRIDLKRARYAPGDEDSRQISLDL